MDELTIALRQHGQSFRPTEDAFQRVVKRGTRRQRTRRIASAVVALGLFAIVDFGILRGLAPSHTTLTPGGPADVPSHGTTSDLVVPGSNGHAPYVGVRPTGRGPDIAQDPADRPKNHPSVHRGATSVAGGASGATTDEDSTPRPMITQSLQVPRGTKGGVNSLNQGGGQTQLNKADAKDGKNAHTRPCSARKTPAARAQCRAARQPRGNPGDILGPHLHVTDPGTPSVAPGPPAETETDSATTTDPAVDAPDDSGTAPADAGSTGDESGATDAAPADAATSPDATPSASDASATSDAAVQ